MDALSQVTLLYLYFKEIGLRGHAKYLNVVLAKSVVAEIRADLIFVN